MEIRREYAPSNREFAATGFAMNRLTRDVLVRTVFNSNDKAKKLRPEKHKYKCAGHELDGWDAHGSPC